MNLRNQSTIAKVISKKEALKIGLIFLNNLENFIKEDPDLADYIILDYLHVIDDTLNKRILISWKTGDSTTLELSSYHIVNNCTELEFILRVNRNYDLHIGLKDDGTNAYKGVDIMEKSKLSFSVTIMNGNYMVKPSSSQTVYHNDFSIIIEGIMEEIVK